MLKVSFLRELSQLLFSDSEDKTDEVFPFRTRGYAFIPALFVFAGFASVFTFYNPTLYKAPLFITAVTCPLVLLTIMMCKKGNRVLLANILYALFTLYFGIFSVVFFGNQPGIHYYHLVLASIPFITFTLNRWINILIISLSNLLIFIYTDRYMSSGLLKMEFPPQLEDYKILTALVIFLISLIVIISDQLLLAVRNEKFLELTRELDQKNRELTRAIHTKDKFLSLITHDLKGPIGNLSNFLELISERISTLSKEELSHSIEVLKNSAGNTYTLLENLLSWSRLHTGEIKYTPVDGDLCPVIFNTLELFKPIAQRKGVQLLYTPAGPYFCQFDTNMVSTIIRNLVNNAVKYTKEGGVVSIHCKNERHRVVVWVKDSGMGIDSKTLANLFRLDVKHYPMPGTSGEMGTGLGLIMCREFIEMHGGQIWAESREGEGSVFYFSIPTPKGVSTP